MLVSPRLPGRCAAADERGFTLVEVLVAGVLMILVLVPSALVMSTSTRALTLNRATVVAANVLAGVLEQDRAWVDSVPWKATAGVVAPKPAVPAPAGPTVNGVTFTVSQSFGWCAQTTSNGVTTWADYGSLPTNWPPQYAVDVTVTWSSGHSVSGGAVFTSPSSLEDISGDGPPTSSAGCPLQ